jgi:hypothetical protein
MSVGPDAVDVRPGWAALLPFVPKDEWRVQACGLGAPIKASSSYRRRCPPC